MPLTRKGRKIKRAMRREYGAEKGARVFYASERSGKVRGVKVTHKIVGKIKRKSGHMYYADKQGNVREVKMKHRKKGKKR